MLHRVLYNTDDSVMIMTLSPKARREGETETEQMERFYQKHLLTHPKCVGLDYEDMDTSALPSDRKDRAKWRRKVGGGFGVDASVVTPAELREVDKIALQAETDKAMPNLKTALELLLKLQENNY